LCAFYLTARTVNITSWTRVILEKLIVTQLLKKFPAFNRTRRVIIVFTRVRHWSLSWARWIQFTTFHPISLRSVLMLYTHLRLCLPTETLYVFISHSRTLLEVPSRKQNTVNLRSETPVSQCTDWIRPRLLEFGSLGHHTGNTSGFTWPPRPFHERCESAIVTHTSYIRGPVFDSQHVDRLSWLKF
jgi:hypothetical protein